MNIPHYITKAAGIFFALPIVLYTGSLSWESVARYWKMGHTFRPFLYISTVGIFLYVMYTVAVLVALVLLYKKTRFATIRVLVWTVGVSLFLYWMLLLTQCIDVLERH